MGGGFSVGCDVLTSHHALLAVGAASRPCLRGSTVAEWHGAQPSDVQASEKHEWIPGHGAEIFWDFVCLLRSFESFQVRLNRLFHLVKMYIK